MFKLILILFLQLPIRDTTILNKNNVINYLKHTPIEYKDVVYAQILIETNSFKSRICKKKHNLFGMHYMYNRRTTALYKTKSYVKYSNWQSSIDDYYLYQANLFSKHEFTRKQYLLYLNHHFAQNKNYSQILVRVIKNKRLDTLWVKT